MIKLISLRRRKLFNLIILFSLCILLPTLLIYYEGHKHLIKIAENYYNPDDWSSIKTLSDKFDFSYLPGLNYLKSSTPELDEKGYILSPGNVQFKFLNKGKVKGSPEDIVKQTTKEYEQLMSEKIGGPKDAKLIPAPSKDELENYKHANATILALVRNEEVTKIGQSIRRFQKQFNAKFNYPYTFLNDQPFTEKFKNRIIKYTENAPVEFVHVKPELWDKPSFIDLDKEKKEMDIMFKHNIAYAKKASYHNMCRFYLGQFYNVPELSKYKYYWRIEPQVKFFTSIDYDVFKYMEDTGKIYGFTINLYDIEESIKTLWPETLTYLNENDNYKYIDPNGSFQWLLEDLQNPKKNQVANGYSTCHFWSNFEIGDMDFFRSEAYNNWFKYLDSTGKFYYERWGDAPVHSIGVSLFAPKDKIHWFRDIGYEHDPYFSCPNTDTTKFCQVGKFSRWEHLFDQNCLMNWLKHDQPKNVY
ncbi:MAG: hypothetical protein M5E90_08535 [Asgard group archaeon]|nr:hypothetical protein [Asgard group archaeon]